MIWAFLSLYKFIETIGIPRSLLIFEEVCDGELKLVAWFKIVNTQIFFETGKQVEVGRCWSDEYGRWLNTSHFESCYSRCDRSTIQGWVLLWNRRIFLDNFPHILSLMALQRCKIVSKYEAQCYIRPLLQIFNQKMPSQFQKTVAITLSADGRLLNFLGAVSSFFFHCTDAYFDASFQWGTHIISPVTPYAKTNLIHTTSENSKPPLYTDSDVFSTIDKNPNTHSLFAYPRNRWELCESMFENKKQICTVSLYYGEDHQVCNINLCPIECTRCWLFYHW